MKLSSLSFKYYKINKNSYKKFKYTSYKIFEMGMSKNEEEDSIFCFIFYQMRYELKDEFKNNFFNVMTHNIYI